jgi:hypothetical protein
MVVSAEEDLAQVIADVQDMGMRVTLLHIANDGNAEIPRALRQECDDIVQISASQLRPFAELISGAEPPRRDDRDGAMLAIRAGSNGNGNGHANGHGNGRALLGRVAQHAAERPEEDRSDAVREPVAAYDTIADYGNLSDYRPLDDYRGGQDYGPAQSDYGSGPSIPDFTPPPAAGRPEFTARSEAPARQDSQLRPESPELPAREELYAAPVAVPPVAEDLSADRLPARPRPEPDILRPVESGYSPGGVRDQFQLEAPTREPFAGDAGDRYQLSPVAVPAAAATGAIRRLPVHNGSQAAQPTGQPSSGPGPLGQPPQSQGPAGPAKHDLGAGTSPSGPGSGGQPIAPVVPMEQPGLGYGGNRAAAYGGPRPVNGPVSLVGQPPAPTAYAGQAGPGGQPGPAGPGDGGPGQPGRPGQAGQQGPESYPALSQVAPPPSAGQQDTGGSPGYPPGGQSGVSLSDAVQSAHEEGQAFGESVARDAPALWLEAVLARKPRMPSDLEARLLQGSALPIDFLLHDEVRHALRRGFWDALEHARR